MAGSNVSLYSTTGSANKAIIGSIDWRENVYGPEKVNDNVAQTMAHIRGSLNDLAGGWVEYGDGDGPSYTPTYVSATSFRIDGVDVTAIYNPGRRVRVAAPTPVVIYGTIQTSAFSTNTVLVIVWDTSVQLSNEAITSVMVSPVSPLNSNLPATLPRSYMAGLGTSRNSGTPTTKIDIAVGEARDSTNVANIIVRATLTIDYGTTGANGLDTGSLANATTYHHFAIMKADGTTAGFGSTSLTPTLPSGYLYKRRCGSTRTDGSAHFIAYSQLGDEFLLLASVRDINDVNPGTSAVTRTLTSIPTGIQVSAKFRGGVSNTASGVNAAIVFSELDRTDEAVSLTAAPLNDGGASNASAGGQIYTYGNYTMRTNTAAQIRSRLLASDASCTVVIAPYGWIDRRNRDD